MSHPQKKANSYSHPPNSQGAGPRSQQDSGGFGPSTWSDAGEQARLYPYELDTLSRSQPVISSIARPQIQGSSNHQTYSYRHGHSLQYPPHMPHPVTHDQGNYMAYQYPTSYHHSQSFHSPQSQLQLQHIPQDLQPAPVPGGSQPPRLHPHPPPHPSIERDSAWERLRSDRTRWDPDAPEPLRRDGESVLMNFTLRGENKIYCRVPTQSGYCEYHNVKKERLLHHVRKDHLNFFPFVCGGSCRSQSCDLRFASDKARKEHINPRKNSCDICGKKLYSQNYAIHYAKCVQRQST